MKLETAIYKIKQHEETLKKIHDLVNPSDYVTCSEIDALTDFLEYLDISALKTFGEETALSVALPILKMLDERMPDCPNEYLERLEEESYSDKKARREQEEDFYASI